MLLNLGLSCRTGNVQNYGPVDRLPFLISRRFAFSLTRALSGCPPFTVRKKYYRSFGFDRRKNISASKRSRKRVLQCHWSVLEGFPAKEMERKGIRFPRGGGGGASVNRRVHDFILYNNYIIFFATSQILHQNIQMKIQFLLHSR
jgi:hypothetical protein